MARASGLHPGGRRFESYIAHQEKLNVKKTVLVTIICILIFGVGMALLTPHFYNNWTFWNTVVLALTLIVLIYYTVETYRIRKYAQEREHKELRGYFGYLKGDYPRIDDGKLQFKFKNFGKTPITNLRFHRKFIHRDSGKELPESYSHTKNETLLPNSELNRFISFDGEVKLSDVYQYDIIFDCEYKTIYGSEERYSLHLKCINNAIYIVTEECK